MLSHFVKCYLYMKVRKGSRSLCCMWQHEWFHPWNSISHLPGSSLPILPLPHALPSLPDLQFSFCPHSKCWVQSFPLTLLFISHIPPGWYHPILGFKSLFRKTPKCLYHVHIWHNRPVADGILPISYFYPCIYTTAYIHTHRKWSLTNEPPSKNS